MCDTPLANVAPAALRLIDDPALMNGKQNAVGDAAGVCEIGETVDRFGIECDEIGGGTDGDFSGIQLKRLRGATGGAVNASGNIARPVEPEA